MDDCPNALLPGDIVFFPYKGGEGHGYIWETDEKETLVYLYEDRDNPEIHSKLIKVKTKDLIGD